MGKKFGLDKQYANIAKGYLQHPVINSVKPKPKPSKLNAGGEMNQMNIKGYMGGGATRGYGAARTSGMGLQDESLMPGKMVRANKGKMLSAKQKKIASKAPPRNKITGADFKAMKVKKASLGLLMDAGMNNKKVMGAGALGLLSMLAKKDGGVIKANTGVLAKMDKFKKEAQRKIFLEMNKKKLQRSIKLRAGKD